MKLDPFYLIVDSARWIERLVPLGVKLVQLRVKESAATHHCAPNSAWRRRSALLNSCQLIVNDYWRLAIDEGCDFVHLGQEDLARADIAAIRAGGTQVRAEHA